MTPDRTRRERANTAGFRYISGWFPAAAAVVVVDLISVHADEVEAAMTTPLSRGGFRKKGQP
jgi:hypothetical protein